MRLVIVNQMRVPKTASDRPRLGDYKLAYKCSLGGHGFSRAENASERGLQPLKNRGISEALIYETALGRVGGSVWESNLSANSISPVFSRCCTPHALQTVQMVQSTLHRCQTLGCVSPARQRRSIGCRIHVLGFWAALPVIPSGPRARHWHHDVPRLEIFTSSLRAASSVTFPARKYFNKPFIVVRAVL